MERLQKTFQVLEDEARKTGVDSLRGTPPRLLTATGPLLSPLPALACQPSPQRLLSHQLQHQGSQQELPPSTALEGLSNKSPPENSGQSVFKQGAAHICQKAQSLGGAQRVTLDHFLLSKECRNEKKNRKVYCSMPPCPFINYNCFSNSSKL